MPMKISTLQPVLNLARRSREIFENSEVDEKRQTLKFRISEFGTDGQKLLILREPFKIIKDTSLLKKCPECAQDRTRTYTPHGTRT